MTESPTAPAPLPPGDFSNDAFWQSPSTYLTLSTYLLPLFTLIFKERANDVLQAVLGVMPLVATVVLVIQRHMNHRNVQQLNLALASERMRRDTAVKVASIPYTPAA